MSQGSWKPNSTTVLSALGRNYRVHLPAAFDSSTYYPLVMFYAGKGGTAEGIEYTFGTDSLPVIAVYPQSTPSTDGSLAWESAPYSSRADDVAFTTTILDQLQVKLCVDKTRIYAAGFSNGGGFASLLSCKLSERIAAIAIVSGAMYAPASDCKLLGQCRSSIFTATTMASSPMAARSQDACPILIRGHMIEQYSMAAKTHLRIPHVPAKLLPHGVIA